VLTRLAYALHRREKNIAVNSVKMLDPMRRKLRAAADIRLARSEFNSQPDFSAAAFKFSPALWGLGCAGGCARSPPIHQLLRCSRVGCLQHLKNFAFTSAFIPSQRFITRSHPKKYGAKLAQGA
jgi:hypothetical protein